jgi:hypothetical protein
MTPRVGPASAMDGAPPVPSRATSCAAAARVRPTPPS